MNISIKTTLRFPWGEPWMIANCVRKHNQFMTLEKDFSHFVARHAACHAWNAMYYGCMALSVKQTSGVMEP